MADNCITLDDISHSLGCGGGNAPGIQPEVIYGYHEDVDVWPDEPAPVSGTPVSLEEAGALIGDVVMKAGTRAYKFAFTEDAGNFAIATDGQVDGMSAVYNLSIVKAKIAKLILGFMNAATARRMFFIVTDENGTSYLMGGKRRGASLVPGGDGAVTGTTASDRNQTTLAFTYRSAKALVYEGDKEDLLVPPTP